MYVKRIVYVIIPLLIVSCNVLPKRKTLKLATFPLELGVVGEQKETLQKTNYHVFGIPNYKNKIKVSVTVRSFDKGNYKKYLNSIKETSLKNKVNYIDSLSLKPEFVDLEIIDNVELVASINDNNFNIYNYLKSHNKATIVSKLRIVPKNLKEIKEGDAFYLQTLDDKQQYLLVFKGGKLLKKINLYGSHVFGYDVSFFCWELTEGRKIKIATMISNGQSCKNKRERDPDDLLEQVTNSTFKF